MRKERIPLDSYDMKPEGMIAYLRYNGWHFNKKMCDWAVSNMYKNGEAITPITKEMVDKLLKEQNIMLENNVNYDATYVANMVKADFYNSSIKDEASLSMFIKNYIDDEDQADGFVFNRFYADCCHNGLPIPWEDLL